MLGLSLLFFGKVGQGPVPVRVVAYSDVPKGTELVSYPVHVQKGSHVLRAGEESNCIIPSRGSPANDPRFFALSPDGTKIAVLASRPKMEIYVLRTSDLGVVAKFGCKNPREARWSPDSRVLGYLSEDSNVILYDTSQKRIASIHRDAHGFWFAGSNKVLLGQWRRKGKLLTIAETRTIPLEADLSIRTSGLYSTFYKRITASQAFRDLTGAKFSAKTSQSELEFLFGRTSVWTAQGASGQLAIPIWKEKYSNGKVWDLAWNGGKRYVVPRLYWSESDLGISHFAWVGPTSLGYAGYADNVTQSGNPGSPILRIDLPSMRKTWWDTPHNHSTYFVVWGQP